VHSKSTTAAIIDGRGKRISSQVLETNGNTLVEFFKLQPGRVHLCVEEGTQSRWLVEILRPHVAELVVTVPSRGKGQKNDEHDAFALAEQLRRGGLEVKVYKQVGPFGELRQLVKAHLWLVVDSRRVQSRLKALYRSRGVATPGKGVYGVSTRDAWLELLPQSSRTSPELLYAQYDGLDEVLKRVSPSSDHQNPRDVSRNGRDSSRSIRLGGRDPLPVSRTTTALVVLWARRGDEVVGGLGSAAQASPWHLR